LVLYITFTQIIVLLENGLRRLLDPDARLAIGKLRSLALAEGPFREVLGLLALGRLFGVDDRIKRALLLSVGTLLRQIRAHRLEELDKDGRGHGTLQHRLDFLRESLELN